MGDEHVPRPEFDRFCAQQNGSLRRIELGLRDITKKIDALAEADTQRVTWEAYEKHQERCAAEFKRLRGRPSWAVVTIIGFLGTATFTMLTLLLARIL